MINFVKTFCFQECPKRVKEGVELFTKSLPYCYKLHLDWAVVYSGAYATHKDEALLAQLPLNKSMASFWGHLLHNLVVALFANVQNMKAIIYLEFFYSIFIFVLLTLNFFRVPLMKVTSFIPKAFGKSLFGGQL